MITQTEIPPDLEPPENLEPEPSDDPDAPYGRDETGSPNAPYGFNKNGKPRKKSGRRKGVDYGSSVGGSSRSSRSLESLREPLTQRLVEYAGIPLAVVSPLAYDYWEMRAEKTADSLLIIAARSPRTRKWIERFVTGSATGDIGITIAGVGTAMMIDSGRVDPQGKTSHWFGLDSLYLELYGSFQQESSNNGQARGLYEEVI